MTQRVKRPNRSHATTGRRKRNAPPHVWMIEIYANAKWEACAMFTTKAEAASECGDAVLLRVRKYQRVEAQR